MGVPGFFAWILRNFKKKILQTTLVNRPKKLYIDANCLFHPECFKVLEHFDNDNIDSLEMKMFDRIINCLNYLENIVNPTEMMYISVDGTAPLAKIGQQRKRRYKSVIDSKLRNEIKSKFGIKFNDCWSNTVITPGTEFMEKLHQKLLDHYKNRKSTSKIQYMYSSYHTPGEGEHKILQHIKSTTNNEDNIVIYGLDADLIFLAMASKRTNIYLLREASHFDSKKEKKKEELYDVVKDVGQDFIFVSIEETKNAYNQQLKNIMYNRNLINENFVMNTDFSNDLIFICFLLGNDFLPHFPSIDINKGGLDELIDSYVECVEETKTVLISLYDNRVNINHVFLVLLAEKMGNKEERFFAETLPNYFQTNNKKKCFAYDEYSKEMWNLENLRNINIFDNVGLGIGDKNEWKFRYYEYYFGTIEHQTHFVNNLCKLYIEGIVWVTQYYFEQCIDWRWQYPFNNSPFISDIAICLKTCLVNINKITFTQTNHIPIMSQLLAVIPPIYAKILPTTYRKLMLDDQSQIIDLFPISVQLDMLYKDQYWKCDPILPILDINRILKVTTKKKLDRREKIRSEILEDFEFS
jgi:5'-3' exonuclease